MNCDTASIAKKDGSGRMVSVGDPLPQEGEGLLDAGLFLYCTGGSGKLKEAS